MRQASSAFELGLPSRDTTNVGTGGEDVKVKYGCAVTGEHSTTFGPQPAGSRRIRHLQHLLIFTEQQAR